MHSFKKIQSHQFYQKNKARFYLIRHFDVANSFSKTQNSSQKSISIWTFFPIIFEPLPSEPRDGIYIFKWICKGSPRNGMVRSTNHHLCTWYRLQKLQPQRSDECPHIWWRQGQNPTDREAYSQHRHGRFGRCRRGSSSQCLQL